MFKYDDTLILFGRSPFINEIAYYIPKLCKMYHTMGCNYFCNSFPDVEYVVFYDDLVPDVKPNQKIITNIRYLADESYNCNNLLKEHKNRELYKIKKVFNIFSIQKDTLHFCIHTPSMALNWAWLKGFKNVILAGIELNIKNKEHFDKDTTPDNNCHDFNFNAILKAREHLLVAKRYLKLYQLNPNNDLDLEVVSINKLLKKNR